MKRINASLVESTRFFLRHVHVKVTSQNATSLVFGSGPQLKAEEIGECFLMYQSIGVEYNRLQTSTFPVFWQHSL